MLGKYLSLSQLSRLNFKKIGKNVLIDKNVIIPFPTNRNNYEFVGDVFDENEQRHPDYWKIIKNVIG